MLHKFLSWNELKECKIWTCLIFIYFIFFPSPAFNVVPLLIDGGDRWSILKCAGGSTVLSGWSRWVFVGPARGSSGGLHALPAAISGNQHLQCHSVDEWNDLIREHWWLASANLMIQQEIRMIFFFPHIVSISALGLRNSKNTNGWFKKKMRVSQLTRASKAI